MKKTFIFCITAIMLLIFVGCTGAKVSDSQSYKQTNLDIAEQTEQPDKTENFEQTKQPEQTEQPETNPSDNSEEHVSYSSIVIKSGNETINPRKFLWHQSVFGEQSLNASAVGAGDVYDNNGKRKIKVIPTITVKNSIIFDIPVGTRVDGIISIQKNGENNIYMSFDTIDELVTLPKGNYIARFVEIVDTRAGDESITEYSISANECLFEIVLE